VDADFTPHPKIKSGTPASDDDMEEVDTEMTGTIVFQIG
jgi:hypothetical protein